MKSPDAPIAKKGFFVTHFLTVKDHERSKEFYVGILGGKVVKPENPCYIKLENSWIILNSGGGPTRDKPEVVLETPQKLNRVSSFLNLRVAGREKDQEEVSGPSVECERAALATPQRRHFAGVAKPCEIEGEFFGRSQEFATHRPKIKERSPM